MTETDSGSDDEQTTTPVENPSDSGTSGGNGNSSNPSNPDSGNTNPETPKATYTITFDANSGSGSIESISAKEGSQITLPANTLAKDGFEFCGWNTAKNMTGTSYDDGAAFALNSNLTLYARWTVTADKAADAIKNLESGEHTFSIVGEISVLNLALIISAIEDNTNEAKINLDLGSATVLEQLPESVFASNQNLAGIVLPENLTDIPSDSFYYCQSLKSVVIPNSVKTIGTHAFEECTALSEIEIPDSVTEIGVCAFNNSGISAVKIGKGLNAIPDSFLSKGKLKKLTVPSNIKSIGDYAFSNNVGTSIDERYLKEVILEEGVETIGQGAFYNSGLVSVTIPKSVKSIGDSAFDSNWEIATVHYNGTKAEWEALKEKIDNTDEGNIALLNATIHCTDGIIEGTTSSGGYA